MDFKKLCDGIDSMACILSVQKKKDGYGDIRIVCGNQKYLDSFNESMYKNHEFMPNGLYTDFIDRNLSFEEFCYKSAVKKEILHSYAYPKNTGFWFHMLYIPVDYETDELAYCMYIMDIKNDFNSDILSGTDNSIATKVLKTTLQLSDGDFNVSINKVIKDIREMCNAAFCCILLIDDVKEKLNILAQDRDLNSDRKNMESYIDEGFYEMVKTWKDTFSNHNCLIIRNKDDFDFVKEKNPVWYNSLIKEKIYSLVLLPLYAEDKLLGYIWVSNFNSQDTIKIKETLEITSFIVSAFIAKHLLLSQLKVLSSIDLLTTVKNRNEMNNYTKLLSLEKDNINIGVLFLDINGLKKTNDTYGHEEGDKLIKRAADVLKSIFDNNHIYRAGGDEFTVILEDVNKMMMDEYVELVREKAKNNNVSFAIGYSIKKNGHEVTNAIKEADEAMYDDKKKYYELTKEKR